VSNRQLRHPEVAAIVAARFYRANRHMGAEYEDLEQIAAQAVWRAEGRYDPHASSLATFSTVCATRDLLSHVDRRVRRQLVTEELGEHEVDPGPSPEYAAIFGEMVRQLPEDARTVVRLVMEDASVFGGLASETARRMIGRALGWPAERLQDAFASIEASLRSGGRGFSRSAPMSSDVF